MGERSAQGCHVRQMKRHVFKRRRRWFALKQSDGHIFVSDGDAAVEFEFLLQPERALEPFRASFRIAHRKPEMTNHPNRKGNLHSITPRISATGAQSGE